MPFITDARYEKLLESELKLLALEEFGVDNWEGYDDAMDLALSRDIENEDQG